MARILMLMNQFSAAGAPADPPRQLAEALASRGHAVDVVAMPWQAQEEATSCSEESSGLRVLRISPLSPRGLGRAAGLMLRWTLSSWRARRLAEQHFGKHSYDLVYATSPAVALWALILWATRGAARRSYLYVVDFFPFHQRAIGLVPGGPLLSFARWAEAALMRRFDVIGCMSERNVEYLRRHYRLRPEQRTEILRLSTCIEPPRRVDRGQVRARYGLSQSSVIAIFGGQITEGRGIDQILAAAQAAQVEAPDLHFVLCGTGRLVPLVEAYLETGAGNLTHIAGLPRSDYLDLAAACDIGLVVTVPIADIPTYPSKTLDYLQAGLPIVAAVEADTDFRQFVEERGFGLVTLAGNVGQFVAALTRMAFDDTLRKNMKNSGRITLTECFDITVTADVLSRELKG